MDRLDQQHHYLLGIGHHTITYRWAITAHPPTFSGCFFCVVGTDDTGQLLWTPNFLISYIGRDVQDLVSEMRCDIQECKPNGKTNRRTG